MYVKRFFRIFLKTMVWFIRRIKVKVDGQKKRNGRSHEKLGDLKRQKWRSIILLLNSSTKCTPNFFRVFLKTMVWFIRRIKVKVDGPKKKKWTVSWEIGRFKTPKIGWSIILLLNSSDEFHRLNVGQNFFVNFSKQLFDFYKVCYMDVGDNAVGDSDINDIFILALLYGWTRWNCIFHDR